MVQYRAWRARERHLVPFRTELCVYYAKGGVAAAAGQIDALFLDDSALGNYEPVFTVADVGKFIWYLSTSTII